MNNISAPGTAYKHLDAFVGKWNTAGYAKASATRPAVEIRGTDSYEWLPGGFFLLHRVDVQMGSERNESIEVIGFDASSNTYPMHFFDNRGNTGTMRAKFNNGTWTFLSDALRFTGSFSEDGKTLSGRWEQSADGTTWTHWMDIRLTKSSS